MAKEGNKSVSVLSDKMKKQLKKLPHTGGMGGVFSKAEPSFAYIIQQLKAGKKIDLKDFEDLDGLSKENKARAFQEIQQIQADIGLSQKEIDELDKIPRKSKNSKDTTLHTLLDALEQGNEIKDKRFTYLSTLPPEAKKEAISTIDQIRAKKQEARRPELKEKREDLKKKTIDVLDYVLTNSDQAVKAANKDVAAGIGMVFGALTSVSPVEVARKVGHKAAKGTLLHKDKRGQPINKPFIIDLMEDPRFWETLEKHADTLNKNIQNPGLVKYFDDALNGILNPEEGKKEKKGKEEEKATDMPVMLIVAAILNATTTEAAQQFFQNKSQAFADTVSHFLKNSKVLAAQLDKYGIPKDILNDSDKVINLVIPVLKSSQQISNLVKEIVQLQEQAKQLGKDEEKNKAIENNIAVIQVNILNEIIAIVDKDKFKENMAAFGGFLSSHKGPMAMLIEKIIDNNPALQTTLRNNQIPPEMIKSLAPILTTLLSGTFKDTSYLKPVLECVRDLADPNKSSDDKNKALERLLSEIKNVIQNPEVLETLQQTIPDFMKHHSNNVTTMLVYQIDKADKKKEENNQKLPADKRQKLLPLAPLVKEIMPLANELIAQGMGQTKLLFEIAQLAVNGDTIGMLQKIVTLTTELGQERFTGKIADFIATSKELPKFLEPLGIPAELLKDSKAIVNILVPLLKNKESLEAILANVKDGDKKAKELQKLESDHKETPVQDFEQKRAGIQKKIATYQFKIIEEVVTLTEKPEFAQHLNGFGDFIGKHAQTMVELVQKNIETNTAIQKALLDNKLSPEAAKAITPILVQLVRGAFQDFKQYRPVLEAVRDLANPNITDNAKTEAILKILEGVQDMAQNNKAIAELLQKQFPTFIQTHGQDLVNMVAFQVEKADKKAHEENKKLPANQQKEILPLAPFVKEIMPLANELIAQGMGQTKLLFEIAQLAVKGNTIGMLQKIVTLTEKLGQEKFVEKITHFIANSQELPKLLQPLGIPPEMLKDSKAVVNLLVPFLKHSQNINHILEKVAQGNEKAKNLEQFEASKKDKTISETDRQAIEKQRAEVQKEIAQHQFELINEVLTLTEKPEFAQHLNSFGDFIGKHASTMIKLVQKNIETNPAIQKALQDNMLHQEAVKDIIPIMLQLVRGAFQDFNQYRPVLEAVRDLANPNITDKDKTKAILNVLESAQKMIDTNNDIGGVIQEQLPAFIKNHGKNLTAMLVFQVEKMDKKAKEDDLKLPEENRKNPVPLAPVVGKVMPLVNTLLEKAPQHTKLLFAIAQCGVEGNIMQLLNKVQELSEKINMPDIQRQLADVLATYHASEQTATPAQQHPEASAQPQQPQAPSHIIATPQLDSDPLITLTLQRATQSEFILAALGINDENKAQYEAFLKEISPLTFKLTASLLTGTNVTAIPQAIFTLKDIDITTQASHDAVQLLLDGGNRYLSDDTAQDLLQTQLGAALNNHKAFIANIVKSRAGSLGFNLPDETLGQAVETVIPLASSILGKTTEILDIAKDFNQLRINAYTEKDREKAKKTKENDTKKTDKEILRESMGKIVELLEDEDIKKNLDTLQDFIQNNKESISNALNDAFKGQPILKNFGGEKIVTLLGDKTLIKKAIPILKEYSKEGKVPFFKTLDLLNGAIISIGWQAFKTFASKTLRLTFTPTFVAESTAGDKIRDAISTEKLPQPEEGKKINLADHFKETYNKGANGTIFRHMLKFKTFEKLTLSQVQLENMIISGFSFGGTKIGAEMSFKNSELIGCNFKGVVFTQPVSFEGAVIDGESLQHLLPAITAYNKNHPQKGEQISLAGARIVGDMKDVIISKGDNFDGVKMSSKTQESLKKAIQKTFTEGNLLEKNKPDLARVELLDKPQKEHQPGKWETEYKRNQQHDQQRDSGHFIR